MSDKHGSEDRNRDPRTPDSLPARLLQVRARKAQERDVAAMRSAIASNPPGTTPMSAVQLRPGLERAPDMPARRTVAFEEDLRKASGEPAKEKKPYEGMMSMNHRELLEYMVILGADEIFQAVLIEFEMDGPLWRVAVTDADSKSIKADIEGVIQTWAGHPCPRESFSASAVRKLTMYTKLAFESWLSQEAEGLEHLGTDLFSLKDLNSIKLPDLPEGKGVDGRFTPEQVKAHGTELHSVFNLIYSEYANRIMAVLKTPTPEILMVCLEDMTAKAGQLDQLVGNSFMKRSEERTMATIIAMDRHMLHGKYSGLLIMQAMGEATTQLTGARLGGLLLELFKPLTDVPQELHLLESNYRVHKKALTGLRSLDIDLHPVLQCFMLQQMASKLATKQEHNMILGIPMSAIVQKGYEDLGAMTAMIEAAIIEATNDPKYQRPRAKHPRDKEKIALAKIAAPAAAGVPATADRICVGFREESWSGFKCAKGADCKFKHEKVNQVCNEPEYAEFARCLNYFSICKMSHPFHEAAKAKYGSPQIAWAELCSKQPKSGKQRGKRGGKAFPMIGIGTFSDPVVETTSPIPSPPGLILYADEQEEEIKAQVHRIRTNDAIMSGQIHNIGHSVLEDYIGMDDDCEVHVTAYCDEDWAAMYEPAPRSGAWRGIATGLPNSNATTVHSGNGSLLANETEQTAHIDSGTDDSACPPWEAHHQLFEFTVDGVKDKLAESPSESDAASVPSVHIDDSKPKEGRVVDRANTAQMSSVTWKPK